MQIIDMNIKHIESYFIANFCLRIENEAEKMFDINFRISKNCQIAEISKNLCK